MSKREDEFRRMFFNQRFRDMLLEKVPSKDYLTEEEVQEARDIFDKGVEACVEYIALSDD